MAPRQSRRCTTQGPANRIGQGRAAGARVRSNNNASFAQQVQSEFPEFGELALTLSVAVQRQDRLIQGVSLTEACFEADERLGGFLLFAVGLQHLGFADGLDCQS